MSRWLDGFDCGKFTIAVNNGLGTLLANQTEGDGEQLVKVPAIIVQLGKGLAVLAALFKELGFESWGVNGLNLLGIKVREEVPVSVSVVDRDWNQKALFKFAAFLIAPFKRFLGDIRFGPSEFHLIGSFLVRLSNRVVPASRGLTGLSRFADEDVKVVSLGDLVGAAISHSHLGAHLEIDEFGASLGNLDALVVKSPGGDVEPIGPFGVARTVALKFYDISMGVAETVCDCVGTGLVALEKVGCCLFDGCLEFHLGSFLNGLLFNFTNIIAQSARIVKPFVKFKVGRVQPYIIPSYPKRVRR